MFSSLKYDYVVFALLVRVSIALMTRSFFQPDEYFQSLEVAHHLVFGNGHLTWEWLSPKPIRSILYPVLNVPIYWLLKATHLDDTSWLIWGPRILHGILASFTDIWLCRLTRVVIGERYVPTAYMFSIMSFFHALSLSRSLSNSLETSLTTMALSYYPWTLSPSWRTDMRKSLAIAAFACAIRPTNAVIWVCMFAVLMWRLRNDASRMFGVAADTSIIGAAATFTVATLDSLYYGKLTFTPLNFLLTNLSSVSSFYGSNPWHYYPLQGFPILCTTALPFALHGAWLAYHDPAARALRTMLGLTFWTIAIYSLSSHKEWRFIHPLLPLLHILAAKSLADGHYNSGRGAPRHGVFAIPQLFVWNILLPMPAIVYIVWFHSRAQIDVIHYLRALPSHEVQSVGFLMPCHSTPWQAYMHQPEWDNQGYIWALGCEPPLAGENITEYRDQTGVFLHSPIEYLQTRFPLQVNPTFPPSPRPFSIPGALNHPHDWYHEWPQYIILFGALLREPGFRDVLMSKGYSLVWEEEYGWDGDENRQGGVKVWKYSISST